MKSNFNHQEVCKNHKLDPKKTSLNHAKCLYLGLPIDSSHHKIECAELGLPIGTTVDQLEKEKKRRGLPVT